LINSNQDQLIYQRSAPNPIISNISIFLKNEQVEIQVLDSNEKTLTKILSRSDAKALFAVFDWNLEYLTANIVIKKVPTHYSQAEEYKDTIFIHEPVQKIKPKRPAYRDNLAIDRSI
jgi:hypothetical protein